MKKSILIKYVSGKSDTKEDTQVSEWLKENPDNLEYLLELKKLWIIQNMPTSKATEEEMNQLSKIYQERNPQKNNRTISAKHRFNISIKKYFTAACIVFLLGTNLYLLKDKFFGNAPENKTTISNTLCLSDIPTEYKHTVYTNKGVKGYVELPDGSKVWLNSDSKITYPDKFYGNTREIMISGEALFDIAKDSLRPMTITTNKNFKVRVLGTKFNIKSYDNDSQARTTLISGSVAIIKENSLKEEVVITKLEQQQSYIYKDIPERNNDIIVEKSDISQQIAWKDGILIFNESPIEEVIKGLERWYGTKFIIEDNNVYNNKFTAELESESLVQVLEMIKFCSLIDYRIKDNTVWFRSK